MGPIYGQIATDGFNLGQIAIYGYNLGQIAIYGYNLWHYTEHLILSISHWFHTDMALKHCHSRQLRTPLGVGFRAQLYT